MAITRRNECPKVDIRVAVLLSTQTGLLSSLCLITELSHT
ncbi:hypothetical protein PSEUDO9AG_60018 [Pseudomonas sp. 9Ag]|nr:hypothetical protein PSEUDO9AG_60018 [Pseudomonas sp. 9Ag]